MTQSVQPLDDRTRLHSRLLRDCRGWFCALALFFVSAFGFSFEANAEELPIPTHVEFVSQWFPRKANSAIYAKVEQARRLATRMSGSPRHFSSILEPLELVRNFAGFDPSQVEHFTSARISSGVAGRVVFFSLDAPVPIEQHFASGQFPITPETHRFHNLKVYQLRSEEHDLGLYSAEGKHFVLGDWAAFKTTLLGNDGRLNELAKILAEQSAPLIICSNPRTGKRVSQDDPFGTVISIDYQEDLLAFMIQEEHPTPSAAKARLKIMDDDMPAAFAKAYGLDETSGVQYLSKADGRHAILALQAKIKTSEKLLSHMLGGSKSFDVHEKATKMALTVIDTYKAAKAANAVSGSPASIDHVIDSLCVGLETKGGKRFVLPFLTGLEQERIADRLELKDGSLQVVKQAVVESAAPALDDNEIRRHARLIATLTVSAAAADCSLLKKLNSSEEIVTAICETGLRGGIGYENELYKGPELNLAERARVASFLVPSHGYLVYKSN